MVQSDRRSTNLQARLTGYTKQMFIQAIDQDQAHEATREASDLPVRRHRIKLGNARDFDVRNPTQYAETTDSSSRIMTLLLATMVSISLLAGGIQIMNILLASVTNAGARSACASR